MKQNNKGERALQNKKRFLRRLKNLGLVKELGKPGTNFNCFRHQGNPVHVMHVVLISTQEK